MTGTAELLLGFGIIGTITGVIVSLGLLLARREARAAGKNRDALVHETLRRAS